MDPLRTVLGLPADAPFERVRHKWNLLHNALGVAHGAAPADIKAAWRKFQFERHPDRHGQSEESLALFKVGDRAQRILLDESLRALYVTAKSRPLPPGRSFEHRIGVDLIAALHGGPTLLLCDVPGIGPRSIEVTLPRGTDVGLRLLAPGEGGAGSPPGDLVLIVDRLEHPVWSLDEERINVVGTIHPTLADIYEGRAVAVDSPWGPIDVKLRAGSLRTHRVAGYGVRRGRQRGDLIVRLEPVMPAAGDLELAVALRRLQPT
jgi:DnaJ-class molecular chaperone